MRVLIADDEVKVCTLLQNIINWQSLDLEIVGIVHDGDSALKFINEHNPDIVITDIRMPGCSGIELIRVVRETNRNIHFIIVSGYHEFDYANQAIKYGVEDYLLKPIKQKELERVLNKIIQQHNEFICNERERECLLQQMTLNIEKIKGNFLLHLIEKKTIEKVAQSIQDVNEEYHCQFKDGFFQVIVFRPLLSKLPLDKKINQLFQSKVKEIVESQVETGFNETIFTINDDLIIGLLNGSAEQFEFIKKIIKKICTMINALSDIFDNTDIVIALSEITNDFEQIIACIAQAKRACAQSIFVPPNSIIEYDQFLKSTATNINKFVDMHFRNEFRKKIEILDTDAISVCIREIYTRIESGNNLTGWDVWQVYCQILDLFMSTAKDKGIRVDEDFIEKAKEKYRTARTLKEVFVLLEECCVSVISEWQGKKNAESSKLIRMAKTYICEHYAEPLTLNSVSAYIGLNPTYFSSVFKRETEENFLDYLTNVRIEAAKEFLSDNKLSISEIAENIGYSDLKYFYKKFKNISGLSPKEYRKLYS